MKEKTKLKPALPLGEDCPHEKFSPPRGMGHGTALERHCLACGRYQYSYNGTHWHWM